VNPNATYSIFHETYANQLANKKNLTSAISQIAHRAKKSRNYRITLNKLNKHSEHSGHSFAYITSCIGYANGKSMPNPSFPSKLAIAARIASLLLSRARFTRREISRPAGFARTFPRRKSRILPVDRERTRTREEECARVRPREPRCAAKFQPADRQARQTRAMGEMLTRRETIDYSCRDRNRQVGREMVFLVELRRAMSHGTRLFPALSRRDERTGKGAKAVLPLPFSALTESALRS